jgi:hypothetical protein
MYHAAVAMVAKAQANARLVSRAFCSAISVSMSAEGDSLCSIAFGDAAYL